MLRPNEWLTNFSISLVLKCAQPNMIVGPNLHGASPTCILDHSLASLLTMNSASHVASSTSWGNANLHAVLLIELHRWRTTLDSPCATSAWSVVAHHGSSGAWERDAVRT